MQEIVFNVIDSRYRAGLPLIVTSNLTAEEIKNPADISYQRIFSRLLEMCVPIEVKGEDRRRKILKNSFSEYSELLGI
jgi:DNA replication protein DnaC